MKIHPDRLEGIRQDQQDQASKARGKKAGNAFGDILSQEVSKDASAGKAQSVSAPIQVNPLLQTQAVGKVEPLDSDQIAALDKMDGLLSKWESYAGELSSSPLRQAYGTLEEIESGLERIKEEMPEAIKENPGLQGLVNDLEVLSVTEKIKFNRGDYL